MNEGGTPVVRLAARGDGVTADGSYVPGAVPGDVLLDGAILPGPNHTAPPCRHFGICGACRLQHGDEDVLRDFVSGRIVGALAGSGIEARTVHPVHLSPPYSRRRAAMRLAVRDGSAAIGFNEEGSARVVPIAECHVLRPELLAAAQGLADLSGPLGFPDGTYNLTLTATETGIDILIANIRHALQFGWEAAEYEDRCGVARISHAGDAGSDILFMRSDPLVVLGDATVSFPPGAFLQPTEDGEAALVRAVTDSLAPCRKVADLFCGLGTFALPLAGRASVLAADAARAPVAALQKAAGQAALKLETSHRDLFRRPLTARELARFDGVVLDPPRAGAKMQTVELAKSALTRIAYVSCNPNTFVRDARRLIAAGFALAELWPVGQFRWSTHVELAALFTR